MSRAPALDFVLVGPFKTGTSWMDLYLRSHPGVSLPRDLKETFYFSQDAVHARGAAWLDALFVPDGPPGRGEEGAGETVRRGEVGPSYFHSPSAPERIHALAPQCRIVCSLREPAARLHSFYLHLLQRGEIVPGTCFLDVLEQRPFLLETARYGHHLVRWQRQFGRERVSVLVYEDLLHERERLVAELCAAIGVTPVPIGEASEGRVNESMLPVDPKLARIAYEFARRLRRGGLHRLVNLAKRSGVRSLLLSRYAERPTLSSEERAAVHERLADDLALLAEVSERNFPWNTV